MPLIALIASLAAAVDLSAVAGAAVHVPEPRDASAVRFSGGLLAGHELAVAPIRGELQLTIGTSPGDGTDDVFVSGTRIETALLGGLRSEVVGGERVGFGLDALAGPAILWRRTATRLYDETSSSLSVAPRVALAAGPWLRIGPIVTAARIQGYLPLAPQWTAYGTVGVRL